MKKTFIKMLLSGILAAAMAIQMTVPAFAQEDNGDFLNDTKVLYANDFEGENALESLVNGGMADWAVGSQTSKVIETDKGKVWELSNNGGYAYEKKYNAEFSDFSLSLDMKTDAANEEGDAPVIFMRSNSQSGGYRIAILNDSVFIKGKDDKVLVDKAALPTARGSDWNNYKIIVVGKKLAMYMNDELVVNVDFLDDSIVQTGGITFEGWRHTINVDNIVITEATEADLPQPEVEPSLYSNDFEGEDPLRDFVNGGMGGYVEQQTSKVIETDRGKVWELSNNGGYAYEKKYNAEFSDFSLSLDMKTDAANEEGDAPVIFMRSNSQSGGYRIAILNDSVIIKGKDDKVLVDKAALPTARGSDWNNYKIIVVGKKLAMYMNDELVVNVDFLDDSIIQTGGITFEGWRHTINVDNIIITEATEADLPQPEPEFKGYTNDFEGENPLEHFVKGKGKDTGMSMYIEKQSSVIEDLTETDPTHSKVLKLANGRSVGNDGGNEALAFCYRYTGNHSNYSLKIDLKADNINNDEAPIIHLGSRSGMNASDGFRVQILNDSIDIAGGKNIKLPKTRETEWNTYEFRHMGTKLAIYMNDVLVVCVDTSHDFQSSGFTLEGWRQILNVDNIVIEEIKSSDMPLLESVKFELNIKESNISKGDTLTLSPLYGNLIDKKAGTIYTSNNEAVKVDNYGVVTAIETGAATITATARDGATASCAVTVNSECNTFYYVAKNGNDKTGNGSEQSPFATIEKARDTIRALDVLPDGGITVYLKNGEYYVDETIVFTPDDSGEKGKPIVYTSYPSEKAVIHSGNKIDGLTKLKGNFPASLPEVAKGKVYVADVEKGLRFHDIYVNGERQQIARQFNTNDWTTWKSFPRGQTNSKDQRNEKGMSVIFPDGALDGIPSNGDVEVYLLTATWWNSLAVVRGIDAQKNTAWIESFNPNIADYWEDPNDGIIFQNDGKYNLMNAAKFIDEPGEWCIDSENGKFYWWPENVKDLDNVIAPKEYELIRLQGDEEAQNWEKQVEYVEFRDLTFMYTDRLPEDQWSDNKMNPDIIVRNSENTDATIFMQGAENCVVADCAISATGAYAIALDHYAKYNRIEKNEMSNLGCGGLQLTGYGAGTKTKDINTGNMIFANYIHDIGLAPYQHSSAVTVFGSSNNNVKFNKIERTPYTAIMLTGTDATSMNPKSFDKRAWFDSYGNMNTQYGIRKDDIIALGSEITDQFDIGINNGRNAMPYQNSDYNIIEYNIAMEYMMEMEDGGCYYAWSMGTNCEYNFNIAQQSSPIGRGWPLYMDDFANNMKIEGNRIWAGNTGILEKGAGTHIFVDNELSKTQTASFAALKSEINDYITNIGGYKEVPNENNRTLASEFTGITVTSDEVNENCTNITMPELPTGAVKFVFAQVGSSISAPFIGSVPNAYKILLPNQTNKVFISNGRRLAVYAVDENDGVLAYANIISLTTKEETNLLGETFEVPVNGEWKSDYGELSIIEREDGNHIWNTSHTSDGAKIYENREDWRNYSIQMEFKLNNWITDEPPYMDGIYDNIGITGRRTNDGKSHSAWELLFRKSGKLELNKFYGSAGHEVKSVPFNLEAGKTYKMKLDFDGDLITCYLVEKELPFGEPIISYLDEGKTGPKLTFGGISIGTFYANADIDNLDVIGIGEYISADSVSISQEKATLNVGDTLALTAKVMPENAVNTGVVWESSDKTVATVVNGVVTALKDGNVTIKAVSEESLLLFAECILTINKKGSTPTPPSYYPSGGSELAQDIVVKDRNTTGITLLIPNTVTNITNPILTVSELQNWSYTIKAFAKAAHKYSLLQSFEINLYDGSTPITKVDGSKIKVTIPFAEGKAGIEYVVLRYNADGTITELPTIFKDGNIIFETDHFSVFAIAVKADTTLNIPSTEVPKTGNDIPILPLLWLVLFAIAAIFATKKIKSE